MVISSLLVVLPTLAAHTLAASLSQTVLQPPGASLPITPLDETSITAFSPYTYFASTAYCHPSKTLAWDCGMDCLANPGFIPTASGGDDSVVQYWYVGFDPTLNTIIAAHEGTDPERLLADLIDGNFFLTNLDPTFFPGLSRSIEVHDGFQNSFERAAPDVLAAVQKTMSMHNTTSVTLVGHSLGAALALLDTVYLPLHLPSGTTFRTVVYGLPRVGNQAFANYIDANTTLTHINNQEDPIPTVPGMFLGFVHPQGEVHIVDSGPWESCPGQDNPSTECIVGDVPEIWDGNLDDHDGPYDGITMGC